MPTQAPTDSDLGFPAKGSLKRVPFAYLVRDIARTRSTGKPVPSAEYVWLEGKALPAETRGKAAGK